MTALSGNKGIDQTRAEIYQIDNDKVFGPTILDCMANLETGGRYNKGAKNGEHRGIFQFDRTTWTESGTQLSYTSGDHVYDVADSVAVAVAELYNKLEIQVGAKVFNSNMRNGGHFSVDEISGAISRWESKKPASAMYGQAVITCAQDMYRGNYAAGRQAIQGFLNYRVGHPVFPKDK